MDIFGEVIILPTMLILKCGIIVLDNNTENVCTGFFKSDDISFLLPMPVYFHKNKLLKRGAISSYDVKTTGISLG